MKLRALVVHPDPSVGGRLVDECERAGFAAAHVRDGERAIDRFVQVAADLVVVDVVLPGRDGVATIESMRWAPGGDEMVVIVTGTTSSAARLASVAREVGATATLPGPEPRTDPLYGVLAGLRERPAASARREELGATLARNLIWPFPKKPPGASGFEEDLETVPGSTDFAPTPPRGVSRPCLPSGTHPGSQMESAIAPRVSGRLADTPFARLLTRLAEQRAVGVLHVSMPNASAPGSSSPTTSEPGPVQKRVYFRAGVPTHVESNRTDETLGAQLVRDHQVERDTVGRALERVRAGEGRLGGILVAMNALSPHALREALEAQQRTRIFDVFQWPDGNFHFVDEVSTPPDAVALELSLVELVWNGVVDRLPAPLALTWLAPHGERFVVPDQRRMRPFLERELPDFARRLLTRVDGSATVSGLLATGPSRRAYVAQLLFALECVGAVSFRDAPHLEHATAEPGPSAGAVSDSHERQQELRTIEAALSEQRWADALGVAGNDARAVEEAAENLDARLRPLAETGAGSRELRARAYAVLAGLARARRQLLDEMPQSALESPWRDGATRTKRPTDRPTMAGVPSNASERNQPAATDDSPASPERAAPSDPPPPANPFAASVDAPTMAEGVPTFLGEMLARGAAELDAPSWDDMTLREPAFDDVTSPGDPRQVLPAEAYTHEHGRAAANSDRDSIQTRAIELSDDQALTVPEGVPTPSKPASTLPQASAEARQSRRDSAPAPAVPSTAVPSTAVPSTAVPSTAVPSTAMPSAVSSPTADKPRLDERELDLEVERMLQAERAFRRGKRALDKGKLDAAVEQFETAERLCPSEGEFLAALGDALWQQDAASDRARELLERGCQLSPGLATAQLALGTLLEGSGDPAGARVAYERALAANPNEDAAVAGLRRLES